MAKCPTCKNPIPTIEFFTVNFSDDVTNFTLRFDTEECVEKYMKKNGWRDL